jgi:predicted O-linked N-acetylglucosamine transferase (SPINDLY family)
MNRDPQLLFQQAVSCHRNGQLEQAERLFLETLSTDPGNFRAQNFLGIIRFQQGRYAEALALIGASLKLNSNAEALSNYGNVLQALGRLDEALASYDKALEIEPKLINALYNRGVTLSNMKRMADALASYDKALEIAPDDADIWMNRVPALIDLNRLEEALAAAEKLLAMAPHYAEAWNNRGIALQALERFEEALASYEKALAIKPDYAEAHFNRGNALQYLGRGEETLASFSRAVAIDPGFAEALYNYGVALQRACRLDDALARYDRALAIRPNYVEALFNRADVLSELRRFEAALAGYDKILALAPDHGHAWNNRGTILWHMKRGEEALASYDRAVALEPGNAEFLSNRGIMLWAEKKDLSGGIRDLEKAVLADPDYNYLRGELQHLKMQAADWRGYEQQTAELEAAVRAGKRVVQPYYYLAISDSPAALLACARTYSGHLYPPAPALWTGTIRRHHKIRLAYLCGEFREHPVGFLTAGLFELHDKSKFEIVALDSGWDDGSATRKRHEAAFDKFIDISKLSDKAAAEKIQAEEIDILIDVNGYTRNHRMGVVARKPAPLQVQYLGYAGTLGAPTIDYILADRMVIPEDQRQYYAENVVYLPDSYYPNDSRRGLPPSAPGRAACGLPEVLGGGNGFVFCNFNHSFKITPAVFAAWMRILGKVEGSVLWLLESNSQCSENLRREAAAHGVAGNRLVFAPQTPQDKHMARLQLADLCIDTLPYNAHTTGSDALWAGVPLVTCRGDAFAGRVAASLLAAIGLPELVTSNLDAYEALILKLARDAALLNSFRLRLQQNRSTYPLFDTDRFRRNIEAAYTKMHEIAERGEAPRSFSVEPETDHGVGP